MQLDFSTVDEFFELGEVHLVFALAVDEAEHKFAGIAHVDVLERSEASQEVRLLNLAVLTYVQTVPNFLTFTLVNRQHLRQYTEFIFVHPTPLVLVRTQVHLFQVLLNLIILTLLQLCHFNSKSFGQIIRILIFP